MAIAEFEPKLYEMTVEEAFSFVQAKKPELDEEEHEDLLGQFENYVADNSLKCSKKVSALDRYSDEVRQAFFDGTEYAVICNKSIDWECFIKCVENEKFAESNLSMPKLLRQVLRVISRGLENNAIGLEFKDRIRSQVLKMARCKSAENDEAYPKSDADSLTISGNDAGGISFDLLFKYAEWSKDSVLAKDSRKILEDYANNHIPYTIARHAAIGVRLPLLFQLDPEFAKELIGKLAIIERYKIAFWDAFVSNNKQYKDILESMSSWYDEFLNGEIAKDLHSRFFYHSTAEHAMLGYLHDIDEYDIIFDKFLNTTDPKSINICCWFLSELLKRNSEIKFKDKIIGIWKDPRFIKNADLEILFAHSPFEKKMSLELLLNYLEKKEQPTCGMHVGLLDDYLDEYPIETAQCMRLTIKKVEASGRASKIEEQLGRLLDKGRKDIRDQCERIREEIENRGYAADFSDESPHKVRITKR